jgi:hypothetical protein
VGDTPPIISSKEVTQKQATPFPRQDLLTARNLRRREFITLLGGAAAWALGGPTILAACPIVFCHLIPSPSMIAENHQ